MVKYGLVVALVTCIGPQCATAQTSKPAVDSPSVLTFEELIELSATPNPNQPIRARLERVLNTPVVVNTTTAAGVKPHRPNIGLGPVVRVAFSLIRATTRLATALRLTRP
jgi:hypothetical protein